MLPVPVAVRPEASTRHSPVSLLIAEGPRARRTLEYVTVAMNPDELTLPQTAVEMESLGPCLKMLARLLVPSEAFGFIKARDRLCQIAVT
ncbi:unnamed protein product [Boreogadus saida]